MYVPHYVPNHMTQSLFGSYKAVIRHIVSPTARNGIGHHQTVFKLFNRPGTRGMKYKSSLSASFAVPQTRHVRIHSHPTQPRHILHSTFRSLSVSMPHFNRSKQNTSFEHFTRRFFLSNTLHKIPDTHITYTLYTLYTNTRYNNSVDFSVIFPVSFHFFPFSFLVFML